MKWKIENKKKSIRIGMLFLWFVFIGALSFTLGKYTLSRTIDSANVIVNVTDFERVYDEKAPYEKTDGLGKYYIHYTGEKTSRKKVDLKDDIADNKILDTQITSTYKMFANNANVEQVLLTEELRDKMSNEMFAGTTQLIDCIYRYDAMKNNNTYTGSEDFGRITASNIDVYYCLENFTYRDPHSNTETYPTRIPNIYVHKSVHEQSDVTSLNSIFGYNKRIQRVLLDDEGQWKTFDRFAVNTSIDKLSQHLKIPLTSVSLVSMFGGTKLSNINHLDLSNYPNVTSAMYMFSDTNITAIPDNMHFFDGNVDMDVTGMFTGCPITTIGKNVSFTGKNMSHLFSSSSLQTIGNNFQLLGNVEDINYMFSEVDDLKFLGEFYIPSTVKTASGLFWESSLTTVPSTLFDHATSLTDIYQMFHFTDVKKLPETLQIPSSVTNATGLFNSGAIEELPAHFFDNVSSDIDLSNAFSEASKFGGIIRLPRHCTKINYIFRDAGTANTKNVISFDSPIVMVYDPINTEQNTYAHTYNAETNVKDESYPNGKVAAIPYMDSIFEKKIGSGPYTDKNHQKYYLRYKKNDIKVDLDYYSTCGKMYWIENDEIIPMTSTYHMFENNANIECVILPDSMKNNVDPDTFLNASKTNIMLLYHDTNNKMNSVPIIKVNNNNVSSWLYLDESNLVTELGAGDIYYTYYSGKAPQVYVAAELPTLQNLFMRGHAITEKVYFDENGTWTDMSGFAFNNSNIKEIINFPSKILNAKAAFQYASIEKIPDNIFAKNQSLNNVEEMFDRAKLRVVDITLPSSVVNARKFLSDVPDLSGVVDFSKASAITDMTNCFSNSGKNAATGTIPIAMVYSESSSEAVKIYANTYNMYTNIHDTSYPEGKVKAVKNLNSIFKKVSGNGPYNDENGQSYHLEYMSNNPHLDLQEYSYPDGKLYWREDDIKQEITTTYSMFLNNTSIERVILPEYLKNHIDANMFDGALKTDIKLIYRDFNNKVDVVPSIMLSNQKVTTWLYLTDSNLSKDPYSGLTNEIYYLGKAENVFISKEVTSLDSLLGCANEYNVNTKRVMFDESGTWTSMKYFADSSAKNLEEIPILPSTITDAEGAFSKNTGIKKFADNWQFPSNLKNASLMFEKLPINLPDYVKLPVEITNTSGMFKEAQMTKIPDQFLDGAQNLMDASEMFAMCENLTNINVKIPSTTQSLIIDHMFYKCENLTGTIDVTSANNVDSVVWTFHLAANKVASPVHPITLLWNDRTSQILKECINDPGNLKNNIYDETVNPNGKILAVLPLPNDRFEKVINPAGPYTDAEGVKYYIRYKGIEMIEDLKDYISNDGKLYWKEGIKIQEINDTYKMFESSAIQRVFLPEYLKDKVNDTIFDGATSTDIKLIYRDPGNISSDSSQLMHITNPNVGVYLYVTDSHLNTDTSVTDRYKGKAKNIYISKEVTSLDKMLYNDTTVEKVCFDEIGSWKTMITFAGHNSTLKEIPTLPDSIEDAGGAFGYLTTPDISFARDFQLPSHIINASSMFIHSEITSIPDNMFEKANSLENMESMFSNCTHLKNINIVIPASVKNVAYCFSDDFEIIGLLDFSKATNLTTQDSVLEVLYNVDPDGYDGDLTIRFNSALESLKQEILSTYTDATNGAIHLEEVSAVNISNYITNRLSENILKGRMQTSVVKDSVSVKVHVVEPKDNVSIRDDKKNS